MPDPIQHPSGVAVARTYLLAQDAVTDVVGTRIATSMPDASVSPRFPALRITEINTSEVTARRWMRTLVQIDCWADRQTTADQLARTVIGVLRETANYTATGAVLGECTDLSTRSQEDASLEPAQPRAIVTAHIWIRPNP